MSADLKCDRCDRSINGIAGLAFSPPIDGKIRKYHFCPACWKQFEDWFGFPRAMRGLLKRAETIRLKSEARRIKILGRLEGMKAARARRLKT